MSANSTNPTFLSPNYPLLSEQENQDYSDEQIRQIQVRCHIYAKYLFGEKNADAKIARLEHHKTRKTQATNETTKKVANPYQRWEDTGIFVMSWNHGTMSCN